MKAPAYRLFGLPVEVTARRVVGQFEFADASGLRAYLCYVVRDAGRWVVKDFDLGARQ